MRMMMRARIPVEAGNVGTDGGVRCVHIFFDLKDASDIPAGTEPFMQNANASVELLPVMNQDHLQAATAKLG